MPRTVVSFVFFIFLFLGCEMSIPKRTSKETLPSRPRGGSQGRKGGTLEKEREERAIQDSQRESCGRWSKEGWMLVPLSDYYLSSCYSNKEAQVSNIITRNASRLHCFTSIWDDSIVDSIIKRENVSKTDYWAHLAVRIYFHGVQKHKKKWRDCWPLPEKIFGKKPIGRDKFNDIFSSCVIGIHDWIFLSQNLQKVIEVGERQAADEKQQKCNAKENPMVSQVPAKKNAPVGLWYFQKCCRTPNGYPFLLSLRPAKVLRGDKKLSVWYEWLSTGHHRLAFPATFSDSYYVSDETVQLFIKHKRLFSFSVPSNRFSYIQKRLSNYVTHNGDYAIAFSTKLGCSMTMYYDPHKNEKKCVLSNAYTVKKLLHRRKASSFDIPPEVLSIYVATGVLPEAPPPPESLKASIERHNLEEVQTQEGEIHELDQPLKRIDPSLLPNGWNEIDLSPLGYKELIYFKRGKPVQREPPHPPKKKKKNHQNDKEKDKGKEKEKENNEGEEEKEEDDFFFNLLQDDGGMEMWEEEEGESSDDDADNHNDEFEEEIHGLIQCIKCKEKCLRPGHVVCPKCGEPVHEKISKKLGAVMKGNGLQEPPLMYLDYELGFDDCDKFNHLLKYTSWPYRRTGKPKCHQNHHFQGYELKIDDMYFTSVLLSTWAIWKERNQVDTFEHFAIGLCKEILLWDPETLL